MLLTRYASVAILQLQAAVPLVASPVFGLTYKATIDTFPGAFLILVAALSLLCSLLLFIVTWGLGKSDSLKRNDEQQKKVKEKLLVEGVD